MKNPLLLSIIILLLYSLAPFSVFGEEIDSLLDMSLEELMDVEVVTATKSTRKISEVPATVRIITAQQIRERGYLTLEDALADLPGFQFRDIVGFNSYSFMRGVPSQNSAINVMVDGVLVNELNSGGFYGGAQYNLSNVKSIEIVYGPASSLYGTNALSGIINILTYDPRGEADNSVSILAGGFNTFNADFNVSRYKKETDTGFVLSGMYKTSDKADLAGSKGDNNWTEDLDTSEDDISVNGTFRMKNFSAGVLFQDKQASRGTNYVSSNTDYVDHDAVWHIRFMNLYAKYVYPVNTFLTSESVLYYRNATVMDDTVGYIRDDDSGDIGQVGYYRPNEMHGLESRLTAKPDEKTEIIAGLVYEEEGLASGFSKTYSGSPDKEPSEPDKPDKLTNDLKGFFVQAQRKLGYGFEVTGGWRYDSSSYYGDVNTPRFALVYNRSRLTVKTLYMEAFRAPRPWDYTYGDGNSGLDPERMRSLELAASYAVTSNFVSRVSIYDNEIEGKFTTGLAAVENGGDQSTDGIEAELEYKKNSLSLYGNYTYNYSAWEDGSRVPEIAIHTFNAGARYKFANGIVATCNGRRLGERKNPQVILSTGNDTIGSAYVVDLTVGYTFRERYDIQLLGHNIFDTEYYHSSNLTPSRFRQAQRNVMLRVGIRY